jgi:hypothetical protein
MKQQSKPEPIYNISLRDSNNQDMNLLRELNGCLTVSTSDKKAKIEVITLEKDNSNANAIKKKDLINPTYRMNYQSAKDTNFTPSNLLSYPNKNKAFKSIRMENIIQKRNPVSDTDMLTFQTTHMLKFSKNNENFDRIHNSFDNLTESGKKLSQDTLQKLRRANDKRDKILFDHFMIDESNYQLYKDICHLLHDYELIWQRLLDISMKENKKLKDENISVLKLYNDLENINESNKKEILYLKDYIGDNDITYKHILRKKKLNEADIIKEEFDRKERANMIERFQLQEEYII